MFFLRIQTQHKIQIDQRDRMFGARPMTIPPVQFMLRTNYHQNPPMDGYPPQYQQPYASSYVAQDYPPSVPHHPIIIKIILWMDIHHSTNSLMHLVMEFKIIRLLFPHHPIIRRLFHHHPNIDRRVSQSFSELLRLQAT